MSASIKRSTYVSENQKKKFIAFMHENNDLHSSKFSAKFTYKDAQRKWEEITGILNAMPGGNKDWKQWRRTWQDLKTTTKRKTAEIRKAARGTGGGPASNVVLNKDEEDVLMMINNTSVEGDLQVAESLVEIEMLLPPSGMEAPGIVDNSKSFLIPNYENGEGTSSSSILISTENLNTMNEDKLRQKKLVREKKNAAKRRLEETIKASQQLNVTCKEKLEVKKNYYSRKLEILQRNNLLTEQKNALLERNVLAAERLAVAAEQQIAAAVKQNEVTERLVSAVEFLSKKL